jgi:hypothetical protein
MSIDPDARPDSTGNTAEEATNGPDVVTPVIVDLGKVPRKQVKRLKRGEGRLAVEVLDVLDEVVTELGEELEHATLVPVVMLYERKAKKPKRRTIELPW